MQIIQTFSFRFWSLFDFALCLLTTWEVLLKALWHLRLQYLPLIV